ncbi:hypothetical protein [Enemella sp. A6]|uniref:hypothetical protein n=1 Tax=Enemella sp. A6 TaxID=3440152 RepID=UPI003EBD8586
MAAELGLTPGEIDAFSIHEFVAELKAEMAAQELSDDPHQWQQDLTNEIAALAVEPDELRDAFDQITGIGTKEPVTIEVDAVGGFVGLRFHGTNPAGDLEKLNAAIAEAVAAARFDAREQRNAVLQSQNLHRGGLNG